MGIMRSIIEERVWVVVVVLVENFLGLLVDKFVEDDCSDRASEGHQAIDPNVREAGGSTNDAC